MRETSHYHRAINGWLRYEGWLRRRGKKGELPFGEVRTDNQWVSRLRPSETVEVRCLDVDHPYVMASVCRVTRPRWHNRIHHARARWIATDRKGVFELGQTYCGRTLSNPLYDDLPNRDCGCSNGPALLCPQCELAFHAEGLAGVCESLRRAS